MIFYTPSMNMSIVLLNTNSFDEQKSAPNLNNYICGVCCCNKLVGVPAILTTKIGQQRMFIDNYQQLCLALSWHLLHRCAVKNSHYKMNNISLLLYENYNHLIHCVVHSNYEFVMQSHY